MHNELVQICLIQRHEPCRYSFGACIAAHALKLEQVVAFVAVSPPLGSKLAVIEDSLYTLNVCPTDTAFAGSDKIHLE